MTSAYYNEEYWKAVPELFEIFQILYFSVLRSHYWKYEKTLFNKNETFS